MLNAYYILNEEAGGWRLNAPKQDLRQDAFWPSPLTPLPRAGEGLGVRALAASAAWKHLAPGDNTADRRPRAGVAGVVERLDSQHVIARGERCLDLRRHREPVGGAGCVAADVDAVAGHP